ncbi:toll-like receptor 4 [Haliotis rubra]|uniref:toll-like receptor 4 n=1 Tax=Haliotis rubra TaxID=36100 RepID=UPI001EE62792|nr:toll-like receptor 4 [Haliotis rubra]
MELARNLLVLVLLLELRVSKNVITSMQAASPDASYVATDNASNDERPDVRNSASQDTRKNADQDTSDDAHQHVNQDQCVPCKCHFHGERVIADCRKRRLDKVPSHLLSNITDLNLSGNYIGCLENGSLSYAHLTRLNVSSNGLNDIELGAFQELRKLEVLDLTHNHLSPAKVYRDGLFKHQAKLKVLYINQNVESRPYDESLNRTAESRPLTDSLNSSFIEKYIYHMHSGNHFGRDAYPGCAFKSLISLQDLRIDGPKELYFGKGFTLKQLQSLSLGGGLRTCYTRYLRNDTFEDVPHLQTLDVSLSITGIGYRFRWKLRYLYYLVRIKHRGYLAAEEEEDGGPQFEFDAFISYADEDRGFVVEDMRRILEGQHELRLCIHHRDFLVGEAIAANILHAIRSSRRTVIILSRNFLKSYWCKYEVEMAKMESIYTGRNTLLVVILEKIPVKNLPPNIVELMRQDSYLEYTDDREGQEVFWESLQRAVQTA